MSSDKSRIMPIVEENLDRDGHTHLCMLMVTHSCNLNCVYCYEKHKSGAEMSFEVAQNAIREEVEFIRNSKGRFSKFQIDFMGGEPLLNYKLIKRVVEWLEECDFGIPYTCFASTNGTVLTEEMKDWFRNHKDKIWLGLSYDGTAEMQSVNRNNCTVDVGFFRETWPDYPVRMTISRQTIRDLHQGVSAIVNDGRHPEVSLALGEDWTRQDAEELGNQLLRLIDDYFEGRVPDILNVFTYRLNGILNGSGTVVGCGAARNMITYDVDGRKYGCHMFTPIVLGVENFLPLQEFEKLLQISKPDPRCAGCILEGFCSTCLGFNYRNRGDIAKRDDKLCLMTLVVAKCACLFQIRALTAKKELTEEDAEMAKVALEAWPLLEKYDLKKAVAPFVKMTKERR